MGNPEPLACGKADCDYTTPPNCPNWEHMIKVLELHVRAEHGGSGDQQQVQGRAGAKQEKLKRPTLDTGITEADWEFFLSRWQRYKRATNITGQDITDQLWDCVSDELARQCHDAGANEETSEKDLLELLKLCSIQAQNKLVNVCEFLKLKQEPDESIQKFITRVRGQAKVCDFTVTCTKTGCKQEVNYSDKLCSHVVIAGLEDPSIQEKVLALATETEGELTLKRITEYVFAQEVGIRSRKLLESDTELCRLSPHRQRRRANTLPNTVRPDQSKCTYCGRTGHGLKASAEIRKQKCPAFGKNCLKCGTPDHFSAVCRMKPKKKNENNSLEDRGSVSDSGEVDGFGFYAMTVPATRPRHKARNFRKLGHHAADMFGKWARSSAEKQPELTVTVSVCTDGYQQVGMRPPRMQRTVESRSLADTGAQMVVAGISLVHSLGVKKGELFPVTAGIKAANSEGLQLLGGMFITISARGSDGNTRTSDQMCYISSNVDKLFLSKATCQDLGIIAENFPEVGAADSEITTAINKCTLVSEDDPDKCSCPVRAATPDPPKELPFPATKENIPRLKEYIINYYRDSAFNTCEQQPIPLMKGSPPMRLFVDKDAKPVAFHKPYPVPLHWQEAVKKQLDNDVKMGVLGKVPPGVEAEWVSRMVVMGKKDPTKPRRCVDFKHLNKVSCRQTHAGKSPFQQVVSVPPKSWKTCLDVKDGYHGVPLHEDDQKYSCFNTIWGRYFYKVLPQGFVSAQDGYNHRYDDIIQDVEDKERCVDDSILWDEFEDGKEDEKIEKHFWRVCRYLSLCGKAGIIFSEKKFQFCQKEVEFVGFKLDEKGVKPTSEFLAAIRDFPVPTDITGIRSWFGLVEQCSYAFSKTENMEPFRHLLKPDMTFEWTEELQKAFEKSKVEIQKKVQHGIETFNQDKKTCLITDFSKKGIGFKLQQKNCQCEELSPTCCPDGWSLVFAGSRFLLPAEARYASIEGECLAAAWAMDKCRYFLLGCESFLLCTDHKPLLGILSDRDIDDISNPRLQRLKEKTLRYRFDIQHISGKDNKVADATSRYPTSQPVEEEALGQLDYIAVELQDEDTADLGMLGALACVRAAPSDKDEKEAEDIERKMSGLGMAAVHGLYARDTPRPASVLALTTRAVTWERLQEVSGQDEQIRDLVDLLAGQLPEGKEQWPGNLKEFYTARDHLTAQAPVVMYKDRVVVPSSLRSEVLEVLHGGNGGVTSMTARAGTSVWWPGITADIDKVRQSCRSCDQVAPSQPAAPPTPPPSPDYPFQMVCSDFMNYKGHDYCVMVDRFSSWISVYKVKGTGSEEVIKILRHHFETYGASEELATDGGLGYTASATQEFLKLWGCRHRVSSAYFPHSNLRAEQGVKVAKQLIRDNTHKMSGSLDTDKFSRAILCYRNTPLRDIGRSPAQIVTGRQLRDHMPSNPANYRPSKEWLVTKEMRELALAKRYARQGEVWGEHTKELPKLPLGATVSVQNQHGPKPKHWDRTGTIVEVLPHQQYKVKMDGSGDVSLRNRRFLKKIIPIQSFLSKPQPSSNTPLSDEVEKPEQSKETRKSSRKTKKPLKYPK